MTTHQRTSWIPLGALVAALLGVAAWTVADRSVELDRLHDHATEAERCHLQLLVETGSVLSGSVGHVDRMSEWLGAFKRQVAEVACVAECPNAVLRDETVLLTEALHHEAERIEALKSDCAVYRGAMARTQERLDALATELEESQPTAALGIRRSLQGFLGVSPYERTALDEFRHALQTLTQALQGLPGPTVAELWGRDDQRRLEVAEAHLQLVVDATAGLFGDSPGPRLLAEVNQAIHEKINARRANVELRQRLLLVLLVAATTYGALLIIAQRQASRALVALNSGLEARVAERTKELDAQRELLASLIASISNPVYWMDREGKYLGCNKAFGELLGKRPEEIAGATDDLLPWNPATKRQKSAFEAQLLESAAPLTDVEMLLGFASGDPRQVIVSKSPLLSADGSVRGLVGVYTDITEMNRLRGRLQQAEKLQSIGQLAAGIAHEINTPIQACVANMEFLKEGVALLLDVSGACLRDHGDANPTITTRGFERLRLHAPSAVEESASAIRRVTEIVRAMRVLSHPGSSSKQSADLNTLVESVATITRNRWKTVSDLRLELDPHLPNIAVSANEISQMLINLVVNAADAVAESLGEGREQGSILIRTRADREGVAIEVTDDGVGMTPEVQRRMFDQFFTTKDVGKGTGQGLSLAWEIVVQQHEGQIDCESVPGVGTTFRVWLPGAAVACPELATA